MATTPILLGLFFFAAVGSINYHQRNLLTTKVLSVKHHTIREQSARQSLVRRAQQQIGVREETGNNDGRAVKAYLASVGLKRPEPWCAAFICWLYEKEGFVKPKSGWCPDLFLKSRLARSALPGNIIGIYFPDKQRIAHVGLIERLDNDWCLTIEGNTNVEGSREGDGVYRKRRHLKTIYRISDWISKQQGK